MKLKVSKKYVVSIKEFLENFLDMSYTGKEKLTHKEMKRYIYEKSGIVPNTIRFKSLKDEDIMRGNYILVRDATGKITAYDNPKKIDQLMIESLMHNQNITSNIKEENNNIKPKVKTKTYNKINNKGI